jgi:hypothetical protein
MTKIIHFAEKNYLENPELKEYDLNVQEYDLDLKGGDSLSLYLRQDVPHRRRSTHSSKSKGTYPVLKPIKAMKMSDSEWLDLAKAGKDGSDAIRVAHKNWASDNFRMHIIENGGDCHCKYCENRKLGLEPMCPDYKVVIPVDFKAKFTLERDAFIDALNVCRIMARYGSNVVKIDSTKNGVVFSSKSEEFGQSMVSYGIETKKMKGYGKEDKIYHYSKDGENFEIYFNVNFILDAIKGMGEIITFKFSHKLGSSIFTDGSRTAILMSMHIYE